MNSMYRFCRVVVPVALVALLAACSSSTRCSKACKHVGECPGAPPCTLSAACTPVEECQAECLLAASCAAITGQDQQAAAALTNCVASCGSAPPTDGAPPQDLKPSEGLIFDNQVFPDYVVPLDFYQPQDTYKPLDLPGTPAVAKFCHNLVQSGTDITIDMKIGSGASQVTLSAYTNTCSTPVGTPCKQIPTGSNIPAELFLQGSSMGTVTLQQVNPGEEWLLILTVVDDAGTIDLQGGPLRPGYTCQTHDPFNP
jgi:hypothetical protein